MSIEITEAEMKRANLIIEKISTEQELTRGQIFEKTRMREIVFARHLLQTMHHEAGWHESKIAILFDQKRENIYNSYKSIKSWKISNKDTARKILQVRMELLN